jgi:hypothetical protein
MHSSQNCCAILLDVMCHYGAYSLRVGNIGQSEDRNSERTWKKQTDPFVGNFSRLLGSGYNLLAFVQQRGSDNRVYNGRNAVGIPIGQLTL